MPGVNVFPIIFAAHSQRGARVVEGARLESGYTGNCIEGSNPFLSAKAMACDEQAFYFPAEAQTCLQVRTGNKMQSTKCGHFF